MLLFSPTYISILIEYLTINCPSQRTIFIFGKHPEFNNRDCILSPRLREQQHHMESNGNHHLTFSSMVQWGEPQPQEDGLEGLMPESRCEEWIWTPRYPGSHPGSGMCRDRPGHQQKRLQYIPPHQIPPLLQNRVTYPWSRISPEVLSQAIGEKSADDRHVGDLTPTEVLCIFPSQGQKGSDANDLPCISSTSGVQHWGTDSSKKMGCCAEAPTCQGRCLQTELRMCRWPCHVCVQAPKDPSALGSGGGIATVTGRDL